jgi:type IV pilus assembly protein PilN
MPDGVYIKTFRQQGRKIALNGYSQSNARVSTLMRNISSSSHLENAVLVEIKAATVGGKRVSEFTMNLNLKAPQADGAKADGAKAGAAKADAAKADAAKKG